MAVLGVHVDHVHGWRAPALWNHIFPHLVLHALFTGEEQVEQVFAVLEPFWPGLASLISVPHEHRAILHAEDRTRRTWRASLLPFWLPSGPLPPAAAMTAWWWPKGPAPVRGDSHPARRFPVSEVAAAAPG